MSQILSDPNGFQEHPLYISVNISQFTIMNSQRIYNQKERDLFFKQASFDASVPEQHYQIIRVDSSGITIIKPEQIKWHS